MTAMDLLQNIGRIDDCFLVEANAARTSKPVRSFHHMKKGFLLAAVIALLVLLVGCTIVILLQYPAMMETIFGTNGRPKYAADFIQCMGYEPGGRREALNSALVKKYIDLHIFPVKGTLSDGQTTLTVQACIVDRTSCTGAVYMKLEKPPLYNIYNSGWLTFQTEEAEHGWYIHPKAIGQRDTLGRCVVDTTSTTDDTLFCVFLFSCEPTCTGLELQLGTQPEKILIPLPEKTDFPAIELAEGNIQITPFGMRISASLRNQDDLSGQLVGNRREISIHFKDGSTYRIMSTGYENTAEDYIGYTYGMALNTSMESYVYIFNRVVDTSQISAFQINDHVYRK